MTTYDGITESDVADLSTVGLRMINDMEIGPDDHRSNRGQTTVLIVVGQ